MFAKKFQINNVVFFFNPYYCIVLRCCCCVADVLFYSFFDKERSAQTLFFAFKQTTKQNKNKQINS